MGELERGRGAQEQLRDRRRADRVRLVAAELHVLDRCPAQPPGPGGRVAGYRVVDAAHGTLELDLVKDRDRL